MQFLINFIGHKSRLSESYHVVAERIHDDLHLVVLHLAHEGSKTGKEKGGSKEIFAEQILRSRSRLVQVAVGATSYFRKTNFQTKVRLTIKKALLAYPRQPSSRYAGYVQCQRLLAETLIIKLLSARGGMV